MNPTPFEQIYPAESRWLMRTYRTHAPYFWPFWVSISGRVYEPVRVQLRETEAKP